MRALSVTRPWAELIIGNFKDIENRSWFTSYRGPLLIHAAKSWDYTAEAFAIDVEAQLGRNLGVRDASWADRDHPTGIVGVVGVLGVCSATVDQPWKCRCSPWAAPGAYHWRLGVAHRFTTPISCRGRLGLWAPGPELAAAIERELAAQMCDLCHEDPATRDWKGRRVCTGCGQAGDYYDSLTPAERKAEEESIAIHVHEALARGEI